MNIDQTEYSHRLTAEYAQALLNKDEPRLVDMTRPKGGAAGRMSDSNVTNFNKSEAKHLLRTIATDDIGIALFTSSKNSRRPVCSTVFEIIDGQVQGDWLVMSV